MMDYLLRDGYFTGAEHAKIDSTLMLMANEKIKIGLATTHVPIKKVSERKKKDENM